MTLIFFIFPHTRIYFTKQVATRQPGRFYPSEGRIHLFPKNASASVGQRLRHHRPTLPQASANASASVGLRLRKRFQGFLPHPHLSFFLIFAIKNKRYD